MGLFGLHGRRLGANDRLLGRAASAGRARHNKAVAVGVGMVVTKNIHGAGVKNRRCSRGVVPGGVDPCRRKVGGIACFQNHALAINLDGESAFQYEEYLFSLMRHRLASISRRLVNEGAAQNIAGEGCRQALIGDGTTASPPRAVGLTAFPSGDRGAGFLRVEK